MFHSGSDCFLSAHPCPFPFVLALQSWFFAWWLFHIMCVVLKSWVLESAFPLEYFLFLSLAAFFFFSIWEMSNIRIWYKGNQNTGISIHSSITIPVGFPLRVSLIHSLSRCWWEGMCGLKSAGAHCSLQNSSCLVFILCWTEPGIYSPHTDVSNLRHSYFFNALKEKCL